MSLGSSPITSSALASETSLGNKLAFRIEPPPGAITRICVVVAGLLSAAAVILAVRYHPTPRSVVIALLAVMFLSVPLVGAGIAVGPILARYAREVEAVLDRHQLDAVLGHEFAHLSGAHPKNRLTAELSDRLPAGAAVRSAHCTANRGVSPPSSGKT